MVTQVMFLSCVVDGQGLTQGPIYSYTRENNYQYGFSLVNSTIMAVLVSKILSTAMF